MTPDVSKYNKFTLNTDPEITIYEVEDPAELFMMLFEVDSEQELMESTVGGIDADTGDEVEFKYTEILESVRTTGCYGISDPDNMCIFLWASPDVNPLTLFHLLGHELGHFEEPVSEDEEAEEAKADAFGFVAAKSYEIFKWLT